MSKVSNKEYERAKKHIELLERAIIVSQERIMEMMDDIAAEKKNYDLYKLQLEHNKDIIMRYEKGGI